MLQLPVTIRVPSPKEMPGRTDLAELLEKRSEARIVPGYKLKKNKTPQLPFEFSADINVNNAGLWKLFLELVSMLPSTASIEYAMYDEEPFSSRYFETAVIVKRLSVLETELSQDAALSIGLVSNSSQGLTEVGINPSKYLQFSGSGINRFVEIMKRAGLKEVAGLAFVDEFPKIIEPLRKFIPSAKEPSQVISELNRFFGAE